MKRDERLRMGLLGGLLVLAIALAGCADTAGAIELPGGATGANPPERDAARDKRVEATPDAGRQSDGTDGSAEIEFKGVVSAIEGNVWTIGDRQVVVPGGLSLTGIGVGDLVEVKARPDTNGQLVAARIRLEDSARDDSPAASGDDHYTEIEFYGVVSAIDGNTWTIDGQQITLPSGINASNIQVGSLVKVEARLTADGQLTAKEIEIEGGYGGDDWDDDDGDDDWDDDDGSDDRDDDDDGGDDWDDDDDGSDDWDDDDSGDDWDDDDSGDGGSDDDDDEDDHEDDSEDDDDD